MSDSPRTERLRADLAVAELEDELSAAKPVNKDGSPKLDDNGRPLRAPEGIRLQVREAHRAFRNKYRPQVNVNPAPLGAGTKVEKAKAGTS